MSITQEEIANISISYQNWEGVLTVKEQEEMAFFAKLRAVKNPKKKSD